MYMMGFEPKTLENIKFSVQSLEHLATVFLWNIKTFLFKKWVKNVESAEISNYRKVTSFNTSCLEAHAGFLRLLMKGIFDPYVLWPFDKKLIS